MLIAICPNLNGITPAAMWELYHASICRSVTDFTVVRQRKGALLLLRVRAAEIDVVDGARSRQRGALG
jgi:hypothetical protein